AFASNQPPSHRNGRTSTVASYTVRCGFTRTEARTTVPRRTEMGAFVRHVCTARTQTARDATIQAGVEAHAGSSVVTARIECMSYGFGSSIPVICGRWRML